MIELLRDEHIQQIILIALTLISTILHHIFPDRLTHRRHQGLSSLDRSRKG